MTRKSGMPYVRTEASPRKAILLAAGFGTRMRPLSYGCPKALMPIWGTPTIDRTVAMLHGWGVRDILVNLHDHAARLVRHCLKPTPADMRVSFSYEPEILGTGGAVRHAAWFIGTEPFWLVNTDIVAELSPATLLREQRRTRALAVLWMDSRHGPRTVTLAKDGAVAAFRSPTPGAPGTVTFCGLQWVAPDILRWLPPSGFSSIIEAYQSALSAGRRVAGAVVPHSFWRDMGTPESYREAHQAIREAWRQGRPGAGLYDPAHDRRIRRLRAQGVTIRGVSVVAADAAVEPGAHIEDSIVLSKAHIGRAAFLKNALVAENTTVRGWAAGCAVSADAVSLESGLRAALDALDWPPEHTTLMPFPARGSDRALTRIECGRRSAVVVVYGTGRHENKRYAGHARFLSQQGVPVPNVLCDLPRQRVCALEDVGPITLLDWMRSKPTQPDVETMYRRVLDAMRALHRIPARALTGHPPWARQAPAWLHRIPAHALTRLALEPRFSPALYRWERGLMAEHFLVGHMGLHGAAPDDALRDMETVARRLRAASPVLLHRDLQSSNVMLPSGRPVFVDFQGMRLGPAAYDLASLLCDPYVMLGASLQTRLLEHYLGGCSDAESVRALYPWAAVQRLGQALGAYGRLAGDPRTARFAVHIPPALRMMKRILSGMDGLSALKRVIREVKQ